jgi:hypothetical protein
MLAEKLLKAGSIIVEGLGRLFKTFSILNMQRPENCGNIYRFLEHNVFHSKA